MAPTLDVLVLLEVIDSAFPRTRSLIRRRVVQNKLEGGAEKYFLKSFFNLGYDRYFSTIRMDLVSVCKVL